MRESYLLPVFCSELIIKNMLKSISATDIISITRLTELAASTQPKTSDEIKILNSGELNGECSSDCKF